MAVGDTYADLQSVADDAELTLQPASGSEAVIHNAYYGGAVEFYRKDGVDSVMFDSDSVYGARYGMCWHVTNGQYLTIKNVSGGAIIIGFDGVYTKVT